MLPSAKPLFHTFVRPDSYEVTPTRSAGVVGLDGGRGLASVFRLPSPGGCVDVGHAGHSVCPGHILAPGVTSWFAMKHRCTRMHTDGGPDGPVHVRLNRWPATSPMQIRCDRYRAPSGGGSATRKSDVLWGCSQQSRYSPVGGFRYHEHQEDFVIKVNAYQLCS